MPNCRRCKAELSWPQPYKKGDRPVNQDGSSHDCGASPFKHKRLFGYYGDQGYVSAGNFIIHKDDFEDISKILEVSN